MSAQVFSQKLFEFLRIQHHLFCFWIDPCTIEEMVAVGMFRKTVALFSVGMKWAEIGDGVDMDIF